MPAASGACPGSSGFVSPPSKRAWWRRNCNIRPDLIAPNGYLHAATVIALADTACGYGCLAHLPTGATLFTTIELKSNFLGTATEGTIACVARPAHLATARRSGTPS